MLRTASLVICFVCLLALARHADAQTTAFFYDAQPGAMVASGQGTITPATATFQPFSDGVSVEFMISAPTFSADLGFVANPTLDLPLSVGTYESAKRAPFNPFNGLSVDMSGTGCNELTGRFQVLEAAFAPNGSLLRFAADFEEHCDGVTPALFGAIRYNSTVSSLTPFAGAYPSYSLQMGTVAHGTVTGGGLSCGTEGTTCQISLQAAAAVQLVATPDPGYTFTGWTGDCVGVASTSITVYGPRVCGAMFDTTIPTSPRTILFWNSAAGDYIGQGQSAIYSPANSLWTATAESTQRGVTISVTAVTATGEADWTLEFRAPAGAVLQPGTYTGATRAAFATTTPGIDVFGDGRGCNTQSGQFTVHEIEFGTGQTLNKLSLDFVQHCEGETAPSDPPLTGTIDYNSTIDIPPPVAVAIDKTQLIFGATLGSGAFVAQTGSQTIRLTQSGVGTATWSASSNVPWLIVSPASGIGSASLTASVKFDPSLPGTSGAVSGSITIQLAGAANSVGPIQVNLNLLAPSTPSNPPFGSFDTPADHSSGMSGSIAVTGWALDAIEVTSVRILRDPVAGEPPGPVFIGNATLIDGARPDVAAGFSQLPMSTRGGWGYLLLTNMLPSQGNGTFRLYAYADDADGHTTLLGTKTITCDNAHATAPFGAIDTPGQGDVVSGLVTNFGWVLAPGLLRADPPGGGTVAVYVDGAPVGSPAGWTSRSDLSTLFPASQYSGVDTALAAYSLDTTAFVNGVHTIAWAVTDNLGVTSGIGSRFFTVSNGALFASSATASSNRIGPAAAAHAKPADGVHESAGSILLGRVGFDPNAPLTYFFPDRDGVVTIAAHELDRIELELEPGATGVMITPKGDKPLPGGSRIDAATGLFTWAPGPGFIGNYEFVLGDRRVRITIKPGR